MSDMLITNDTGHKTVTSISAEDFFEECKRIAARLEGRHQEQWRWRYLDQRLTASYSGMPHGGGAPSSGVERAVEKIEKMQQRLAGDVLKLESRQCVAETILDMLSDDRYSDVLRWRYINGWPWARVTKALCLERRQTFRVRQQALAEVQQLFERFPELSAAATSACRRIQRASGE